MQIHETAFVISTYRSLHVDISNDTYAWLWNNPATDELIPGILKSVSEHEALLHCIRNRFFDEQLKVFFNNNNNGIFINFGAGFSMYQFQLPESVHTIEIDKEDIVTHKKQKVDQWIKEGKLPERKITYLSIDFNTSSENEIVKILSPLIKKSPTFILIEGVLFFLDRKTTNKIFRVFNQLQNSGDLVGSVSYTPEVENTDVYNRLLHYFDSNNDTNDSFNHQTIPNSYYTEIDGFVLKENTDEFALHKTLATSNSIINKSEILNESMYILEKV